MPSTVPIPRIESVEKLASKATAAKKRTMLLGRSANEASRMLAPESVIAWVVIGAVAGWLASLL
jgi:hypothetical protein